MRKPICGYPFIPSEWDLKDWKFLNGLLKPRYKGVSHSADIIKIPLFPAQLKQFVVCWENSEQGSVSKKTKDKLGLHWPGLCKVFVYLLDLSATLFFRCQPTERPQGICSIYITYFLILAIWHTAKQKGNYLKLPAWLESSPDLRISRLKYTTGAREFVPDVQLERE